MKDFKDRYNGYLSDFESYAKNYVEKKLETEPRVLGESMAYSLLSGGKRIRPVLMLACADVLEVRRDEVLPFALALEMIHCYSLIHDDLPAMDNDDFRRGKPTNHKVYGEANAILAGDGLLNEAYHICFRECEKGERQIFASGFLNACAGVFGMIAGQSADMYYSQGNKDASEEELRYIHECKTGKLLLAAVLTPCFLSGNKEFFALERFGKLLGLLFQITDDILDVTATFDELGKTLGKDEVENKLTYVRLYGLEGAKVRAEMCAKDCHAVLEVVEKDTEFLHALIDYVYTRKG